MGSKLLFEVDEDDGNSWPRIWASPGVGLLILLAAFEILSAGDRGLCVCVCVCCVCVREREIK